MALEQAYEEDWPEQWKQERKYKASQQWTIVVPVGQAQTIIDIAVAAGANEVLDVNWAVSDEAALQAKAYSAALSKVRNLASQMARELNTKLGELLYASNTRPVSPVYGGIAQGRGSSAMTASLVRREPMLKLFPQKVEEQATVYAIFAIE